ncbi:hypothetical protein ACFU3E_20135 [Streptomyces sp. NPDC057424]|uniref:hypothetical protein n=1 Tax=Streptomyces sp. NPDC057424 TaxID=3346127 RepID=UPI003679B575
MKKRRILVTAGVLGTALVNAVAFSGSAHAKTGPGYTEFCSGPMQQAGFSCFYSDGDRFSLTDNYADGLRTVLRWQLGDRTKKGTSGYIIRKGECHNTKGAGKTIWCDYDFPEGKLNGTSRYLVHFKIESQDGPNGKPVFYASAPIGYVSGR